MTSEQLNKLENDLWQAATILRNSSGLKSNEYSTPILGIVFLRFAETVFAPHAAAIDVEYAAQRGKRNETTIDKIAIARCGFYLPSEARYDYLLQGEFKKKNIFSRDAIQDAMRAIEKYNDLADTLPINEYDKISSDNIDNLLKKFAEIPISTETDVFGKIYEFFLGEFAIGEGQKGGEFYTPPAVVRLMVEVIEPNEGRLLDPACGSGGMFVQSANFLKKKLPGALQKLAVTGFEKSGETAKLAKMNCKINGVRAEILTDNTFSTSHDFLGKYDYVLANPPFNVKEVKAETVEQKPHFNAFGLPKNKGKNKGEDFIPNANYLWINLFAAALKPGGKAGLVMANSASDASGSELDIRKRLVEQGIIGSMLTLSTNMFNTVTLPATLWFFNKPTDRDAIFDGKILFVDARNVFTQISRKQRTFSDEQVQNIATIFRLFRGENDRFFALLKEYDAKRADFEQQAAEFYPFVTAALAELATLEKTVAEGQKNLDNAPAADKKARERAEKDLAAALRDRNRQQKEAERLQNEHAALEKQRDYFQKNHDWLAERFPDGKYADVTGLCKAASLAEIEEQNFSLNPGRYVGVVIEHDGLTAAEFSEEMRQLHAELARLDAEAHGLEAQIAQRVAALFPAQQH